jgi:ssDNA-binding Zn-finger/Zn-ribbon topoisomerase 1
MSNLVCPVCGSSNIQTERRPDGFHHCTECRYSWAIGASQQKQTVFDHITESVEALAEKFVYHIYLTDCLQRKRSYWRSTFFPCNNFSTKEKAIAVTVEELKKEWKK